MKFNYLFFFFIPFWYTDLNETKEDVSKNVSIRASTIEDGLVGNVLVKCIAANLIAFTLRGTYKIKLKKEVGTLHKKVCN